MSQIDIKSMNLQEITQLLAAWNQPKYRAAQIFKWLYRGAASFDEMTDISAKLRDKLACEFFITKPAIIKRSVSATDATVKYLWQMADGICVESVLMRYHYGNSICISTQAGCKMGCVFCASTGIGFDRNLSPSELIDQILFTQLDIGERISHVVLMGIGEPLDNFDNVIKMIRLVNHPDALGIGMRNISLSTCGLPGAIMKLAQLNLQITLSVSLHAPDDQTRSALMPANRAYGISQLLEDCRNYFKITGRRVTLEYALINNINDSEEQAEQLAQKIKGDGFHVNLIPLNVTPSSPLKPSEPDKVEAFKRVLEDSKVSVTIRRKLGADVNAACGQLRRILGGADAEKG